MKIFSYLSFIVGIFLVISELFLERFFYINDTLGFMMMYIGILSALFGVVSNKTFRDAFISFIMFFI